MPCAASPPMTFCHENVVTSSLSQGRSCAKAALVASQIVSPARSDGIAFPFGSRTPDVVPFHVKTTSVSKSTPARSTISPYSAVLTSASSLSCFTASVTQPAPKLSQASMVQGRTPSIDHIAISTAPVSDAGTMPMRYSSGTPRMARVVSIAALSLALPTDARCERPSGAPESLSRENMGGFAQGPDEKRGFLGFEDGRVRSGRVAGCASVISGYPLRYAPLVGEGCPAAGHTPHAPCRQAAKTVRMVANDAPSVHCVHHRKPRATFRTNAPGQGATTEAASLSHRLTLLS